MATGLPILPSDRIYTRGLVTTYAMVPSLAAFGLHDWSARLPSVIAGALLVPASFLLGRAVAGPIPGLALAAFVALAGPLVEWSRQAWPPATFLLLFTLATYASYRGFARDEPRWQPLAALGFLLTLLAYELAMLLPLGLGLYLAGRMLRRDLGWWQGRWTLAALAIGALGLGLLAVLGLALRAGSLAGRTPSSATTSPRASIRLASATTSRRSGGRICRCSSSPQRAQFGACSPGALCRRAWVSRCRSWPPR